MVEFGSERGSTRLGPRLSFTLWYENEWDAVLACFIMLSHTCTLCHLYFLGLSTYTSSPSTRESVARGVHVYSGLQSATKGLKVSNNRAQHIDISDVLVYSSIQSLALVCFCVHPRSLAPTTITRTAVGTIHKRAARNIAKCTQPITLDPRSSPLSEKELFDGRHAGGRRLRLRGLFPASQLVLLLDSLSAAHLIRRTRADLS